MTDVPPELALNYYVGKLTIQDSWTEHEARVLWKDLSVCGIVKGQWAREFGRLLPRLEDAFKLPQIPNELRDIALPLLALTRKWHKYRADLVHDMVTTGWGKEGEVQSAIGNDPRSMDDLIECGETLRICANRLRGLYSIVPWWLGGPTDSWTTADYMRSWTRVAMGHLADVPNSIQGTPGPAPEPPGGWDSLVAEQVAKREAEEARLKNSVWWVDADPATE